jgi:hypothetical protein
MIITKADMKRRKNVSEIAEASVAKRMKIVLVAKKNEAMKSTAIPLDGANQRTLASVRGVFRTPSFNYPRII